MSSPHSGAQLARQALADRLRELRLDAGLTSRALAAAAGWHEAKTSRIEHGKKAPFEADVRAWADACGRSELVAELIAELRAADSMWLDWRRAERSGLKHLNVAVRDLYERTRRFRIYSSVMIPGPVQTADYVTAVLTAIRRRRGVTVDDVAATVAERMARQHIVYEGDHRFAILLEEATLRMRIGGSAVLAGQLRHLLAIQNLPSMALGIIPAEADRSAYWPVEMFFCFDDAQVSVELVSGFLTVTSPREVAMYTDGFADLAASAVYGQQARELIVRALEALG
ncbi:helix-turn-helix domain-containing protein [Nonomuraea sp. NPDC003754]